MVHIHSRPHPWPPGFICRFSESELMRVHAQVFSTADFGLRGYRPAYAAQIETGNRIEDYLLGRGSGIVRLFDSAPRYDVVLHQAPQPQINLQVGPLPYQQLQLEDTVTQEEMERKARAEIEEQERKVRELRERREAMDRDAEEARREERQTAEKKAERDKELIRKKKEEADERKRNEEAWERKRRDEDEIERKKRDKAHELSRRAEELARQKQLDAVNAKHEDAEAKLVREEREYEQQKKRADFDRKQQRKAEDRRLRDAELHDDQYRRLTDTQSRIEYPRDDRDDRRSDSRDTGRPTYDRGNQSSYQSSSRDNVGGSTLRNDDNRNDYNCGSSSSKKEDSFNPYMALYLKNGKRSTDDEIRDAYKNLSNKHHPDHTRAKSKEEQARSAKRILEVNRAKEILFDEDRRRAYDQEGILEEHEFKAWQGRNSAVSPYRR